VSDRITWLAWSSAFLVPWILLFWRFPAHRKAMLWASAFTAPFGLTEPLFVPEYWSPPSLFDLALRTGFDLESLIFCFGIGGVAAVLHDVLDRRLPQALAPCERHARRHRFHWLAVASPFLVFPALLPLPWNPIYPGIVAMAVGAIATVACRPDLARKSWRGGVIFVAYYALFLQGLRLGSPGYVERVWNLDALSGVVVLGMPLEELLFAAAFGAYWSGVYDHLTWHASWARATLDPPAGPVSASPARPQAEHVP